MVSKLTLLPWRVSILVPLFLCSLGLNTCAQINLGESTSNEICSDNFDRADADRVGGNWDVMINYPQASPPEIKISGNRALFNLPGAAGSRLTAMFCKNRIEQPHVISSVEITSNAAVPTGSQIMLVARLQELNSAYTCNLNNQSLKLARGDAGVNTNLATDATVITLQPGIPAKFTFETNGSSLSCQLQYNGQTIKLTATDSTFTAGKTGMFVNASSINLNFYADNFVTEVVK
jgi:hypothetical protein